MFKNMMDKIFTMHKLFVCVHVLSPLYHFLRETIQKPLARPVFLGSSLHVAKSWLVVASRSAQIRRIRKKMVEVMSQERSLNWSN